MIDVRPVYLCDAVRTPFGRYAGVLSGVRTDDLAALPIAALRDRNAGVDWQRLDDVVLGCANQAGEDNRNVGRMALLLAGLPQEVPGSTVNRLCGSSMDAVVTAARAIGAGEMELVIAGGVESMSRAPFVMNKARRAVRPRRHHRGHHPRLALRQPEDGAGIRHPFDGRDRRERGGRVEGLAGRSGRVRAAQPAARRRRDCGRAVRRRDRSGDRAAAQGPGHRVRPTSIRGRTPRSRRWPS